MGASYPTKLILAFRSGGVCAICKKPLTVDSQSGGSPSNVGEAAHIAGEERGAARYDERMTDDVRNGYKNLIYLCSCCHTIIDAKLQGERDYPVERLLKIKEVHEGSVRKQMLDAFSDVGFPELAEATKWAQQFSALEASSDYSLLTVDKKLERNSISIENRAVIASGLSVANEVDKYIKIVAAAQPDDNFPERLKAGFLEEYNRLVRLKCEGDSLFEGMCSFAQKGMKRQVDKTAGLAVLIHFFETCEVFKK